jgi:hypothetical protein
MANDPILVLILLEQDFPARIPTFGYSSHRCATDDQKKGCQKGRCFIAPTATDIDRFNPFTHLASWKKSSPQTKKCM